MRASIRDAESAYAWKFWGRVGLGILLICVIGAIGGGECSQQIQCRCTFPLSTRGTLHVIFGTSQLVLLPFAALFINLSLARNNENMDAGRGAFLRRTAGLPLFGFLAFAAYSAYFLCFPFWTGRIWPRPLNIGWPPRFAFSHIHAVGRSLRVGRRSGTVVKPQLKIQTKG